jgi:hypothetical protein
MEYTYQVLENGWIKRTSQIGEVVWIPNDEANSDYQQYLAANEPVTKS